MGHRGEYSTRTLKHTATGQDVEMIRDSGAVSVSVTMQIPTATTTGRYRNGLQTDGSWPPHCHRTRNDGMLMEESHACTHSNIIPSAMLFKRAVGRAQIRTEFLCWACRMQAWWSPRYRIKPISLFWRDVFYLASCWCLRIF